jgi:hypothetical protein
MKNRFFANAGFFAAVFALGFALCACDGNRAWKLEKLPSDATKAKVQEVMDEILSHSESSKADQATVEKLKRNMSDITDDDWKKSGELYITIINKMIPIKQPLLESVTDIVRENQNLIMPVASLLTVSVSLLGVFVTIIINFIKRNKDDRNKMYLQLEFASIEFFKWEADKKKELVEIRNLFREEEKKDTKRDLKHITDSVNVDTVKMREDIKLLIGEEGEILLDTWCTQQLNLFELMVEHTLKGKFPMDIFETWLPWIYEFAKESGTKKMWISELCFHYSSVCGTIVDYAVSDDCKNMKQFKTYIKKNLKKLKELNAKE